jgi:putative membrane protein
MKDQRKYWMAILLLGSFFLFGLFFHLFPPTYPLALSMTSWVLFIVSALVYVLSSGGRPDWYLWSVSAFVFTFMAEAVGVATGEVFGAYEYTDVLGFSLLGVPLIIGLNWVMVCAGAMAWVGFAIPGNKVLSRLIRISLAAALCTGFDALLEPVAVRLGYWIWEGVSVPLRNYEAWFVLGLGCCALFEVLKLGDSANQTDTVMPRRLFFLRGFFLIQVLFFGGLNLAWAIL